MKPLAEQCRPKVLDDWVGQSHLLGPGAPLKRAIEGKNIPSMILWGPPGCGKTSLATLIASEIRAPFFSLSAVLSGVKDVRDVLALAEKTPCILFIDEIHRFNKAQQDAFLRGVELGHITLIGATTENPSFSINNALLSRCTLYVLEKLSHQDLLSLAQKGIAHLGLDFTDENALSLLVDACDGDARRLYNLIENMQRYAGQTTEPDALVKKAIGSRWRQFDKSADGFYDGISALHKSVRGSDPDAALYWFVRLIDGGIDPLYIGRRLIRIASEDIGNADLNALTLALNAFKSYQILGSPEGELALAQCLLYLSVAPKSNAAYKAYCSAVAFVKDNATDAVPTHLRNASTNLLKQLNYGKDYRYDHDENGFAAGQTYWPKTIAAQSFYKPVEKGLEVKIKEKLAHLKEKMLLAQK